MRFPRRAVRCRPEARDAGSCADARRTRRFRCRGRRMSARARDRPQTKAISDRAAPRTRPWRRDAAPGRRASQTARAPSPPMTARDQDRRDQKKVERVTGKLRRRADCEDDDQRDQDQRHRIGGFDALQAPSPDRPAPTDGSAASRSQPRTSPLDPVAVDQLRAVAMMTCERARAPPECPLWMISEFSKPRPGVSVFHRR